MFALVNQLKMFRFIKGKVDIYTKVLKVLGLNMEPTLDLQNKKNIPNTMDLEIFYNKILLIRLHFFQKYGRRSYSSLMVSVVSVFK